MTTITCAPQRSATPRPGRGVAMMLVLIALAVGTVIGASVLTARQTAPHIAVNAADSATADWSAQSGAEIAVAVLQTDVDWTCNGGVIMDDYAMGDAMVDVVITDIDGQPPTPDDRELIVTVTATVGDMTTTVEKHVSIAAEPTVSVAVDPYWGEFCVLATSSLRLQNSAEIRTDPSSPESGTAFPVKIGTSFVAAGSYSVMGNSKIINCELYVDQKGSALLKQRVTMSPWVGGAVIPLNLPIYHEAPPPGLALLPLRLPVDLSLDGPFDSTTLAIDGLYQGITLDNGAELTLDSAFGTLYSLNALDVRNDSVLRIVGNVRLVLRGPSVIQNGGTIELATPASRLTIYAFDGFKVVNAGLGVPRDVAANPARSPADLVGYHNPRQVRILSISPAAGGTAGATFEIDNQSIAVATIHAPSHTVTVKNASWLLGRLTGSVVDINGGTVLYSPGMDSRNGFSVLSGPLYDANEVPRPAVTNTIAAANPALGAAVIAQQIADAVIAELAAEPVVIPPVGDPTPREGDGVIETTVPKTANQLEEIVF